MRNSLPKPTRAVLEPDPQESLSRSPRGSDQIGVKISFKDPHRRRNDSKAMEQDFTHLGEKDLRLYKPMKDGATKSAICSPV